MGFGPTYVAHIPPIVVWYSRDSLCYGVGACMAYITAKAKKKHYLFTEYSSARPRQHSVTSVTSVRKKQNARNAWKAVNNLNVFK